MARMLIIDDDKALASMVEEWMTSDGHDVQMVHNGTDGLNALKSGSYDVVILDWHMPDMEGIDVLRKFRKDNSTTPVIMLTGNKDIDAKEAGFDSGANDYLTKPFNLRELSARLRSIYRNRPAETQSLEPLGKDNAAVLQKANLAGTQLAAKYEFIEVLGEGAWGVVFKARHPFLEKMLAVKMLKPLQMDDNSLKSFQFEGKAISNLDHKNIVTVHDFGITERRHPFMVMEYIDGPNLDETLDKFSFLPLDVALKIMIQVCDGITQAHLSGIVHRDLKPANIVLKEGLDGQLIPKILDFGLACFAEREQSSENQEETKIAGSLLYMAPEIFKKSKPNPSSDIYAIACILFELLTGATPIVGENAEEVIHNHLFSPPLTLAQVRPNLDFPELQTALDRALQKEPEQRFQTARQFQKALQAVADSIASSTSINKD